MTDTLRFFLLILCASFVFSTLLGRLPWLRIPAALGYLGFGMLLAGHLVRVGPEEAAWIQQLGELGMLFLMYLSGLEVDMTLLKPHLWKGQPTNPLFLAISLFCTSLVVSLGAALALTRLTFPGAHPWMLTLLLATTSMGIILPVLEESRQLLALYGQTLLLCALIADVATMFLLSLFVSVHSSGQLDDFLLTLSVFPLAFILYRALAWGQRVPALRRLAGDAQARMRAVVALLAGFCAVAEFTGSEPILGSFLVGMLVSALPFAHKQRIKEYSHGIGYGLLIPVFFLSVGLQFDFVRFYQSASWTGVLALLAAAFVVKLAPAWQLRRSFGRRAAAAGGFLLSARLSLIIAAAEIGVKLGLLPEVVGQSVILVAVITCIVSPVAFLSLLG
ncbi:cation:proton antiporter [Alicyclobacillus shizuokensis]|uniref:cation:proton antiporter n=1 Tax=Alicyclobacillus shizuokensis TaxID=392014 RepID=UPI000832D7E8|nr:cation:proton antiporter [Alicyclobacillus shizuokensis]MCL6626692.1 cation:proton antiporter [Alicyclobacillus shizuokensis]